MIGWNVMPVKQEQLLLCHIEVLADGADVLGGFAKMNVILQKQFSVNGAAPQTIHMGGMR